ESLRSPTISRKPTTSPQNADMKSGRAYARPTNFVSFAGSLWLDAKRQSSGAIVSIRQLEKIASSLDAKQYVPPAEYLEGRCARELKAFNSRHSNSKSGSIQTWERLVAFGDKDHLRCMRRLLSRCAENHPR